MAFASLGSIPGPVETGHHIYLMKTRARNDLGDENRYGDLMKDFPLGRAKATLQPSSANASAVAAPMPIDAPVISTLLPRR